MDIESKIARFFSDKFQLEPSELEPDRSLFEADILDSVRIFDLVGFLEEEFGLDIADEQIVPEHFESLNAIASFVKSLRDPR